MKELIKETKRDYNKPDEVRYFLDGQEISAEEAKTYASQMTSENRTVWENCYWYEKEVFEIEDLTEEEQAENRKEVIIMKKIRIYTDIHYQHSVVCDCISFNYHIDMQYENGFYDGETENPYLDWQVCSMLDGLSDLEVRNYGIDFE